MSGLQMRPVVKMLNSADGTRIYADAVGDPTNPPIVFVLGFGLSSVAFESVFTDQKWIDRVYLVRYDGRGQGRSDKPESASFYESQRLSEDFDAVVQAFKLIKPFIAGWSLGATIIADVLSFHPASFLSGIIQIAPAPYLGPALTKVVTPSALGHLLALLQSTDMKAREAATRSFITLFSASLPQPTYEVLVNDILGLSCEVMMRMSGRAQNSEMLLDIGRNTDFPLLLITAKYDNLTSPVEAVKAMAGWKNMTAISMEDSGHMPWIDEPIVFRREVLGWVKKIRSL